VGVLLAHREHVSFTKMSRASASQPEVEASPGS